MITPSMAALAAINTALAALNLDCLGPLPSDDLVTQATELLMLAREMHTDKPFPEMPFPLADRAAFDAQIAAWAEEQKADGRL